MTSLKKATDRAAVLFFSLSNHPLSRDAVIYALSKVVPGAAGLLAVLLFVRAVGLDEYGKYAFWFSLLAMAASLCGGWMNQAQLRFANTDDARSGAWLIAIFVATSLSILAVECCVFLMAWLKAGEISWDAEVFVYGMTGAALIIHAARVTALQARMQARRVLVVEILRGLLGLAIPLGVAWVVRQDHVGLMIGLTVAYVVAVGQSWYSLQYAAGSIKFDITRIRKILFMCWRFGWPLSVWVGVLAAFPVVDRYLIQHFLGYGATGQYAALYDLIVRSYSLLFFPVVLAAHPRIMAAANAGASAEANKLIRHAMAIQFGLFVPVFIVLAVSGQALVDAVLPGDFNGSVEMVMLLALSGFLWQIALLVHKPLEIAGRVEIMVLALGAALLVSAGVGAWGAQRYGLNAFAIANVLASIVYVCLCMAYMWLRSVKGGAGKDFLR